MKRLEACFLAANRWALILLLAAMALLIFANVVLRYLTSQSIEWAEEVARHLMIWLTFLGLGPVLRSGGHLAVENLQDALPPWASAAARAVVAALLLAFFGFFVWVGIDYMARTQYQQTPATQISFAWVYAALPVGAALALVHWLLVVRGYLRARSYAADNGFDAAASASL